MPQSRRHLTNGRNRSACCQGTAVKTPCQPRREPRADNCHSAQRGRPFVVSFSSINGPGVFLSTSRIFTLGSRPLDYSARLQIAQMLTQPTVQVLVCSTKTFSFKNRILLRCFIQPREQNVVVRSLSPTGRSSSHLEGRGVTRSPGQLHHELFSAFIGMPLHPKYNEADRNATRQPADQRPISALI